MATLTATIGDFNMSSSWSNKNGAYSVRPSQSTATQPFTVSGLPAGAKITGAVYSVTIGSPLTGAAILRINEQNAATGNYTQDVKSIVTGNGTFEFTYVFKANGDPSMSDGYHYGNITFTGSTITITYEAGTPEPEPDPEIILASDQLVVLFEPKDQQCKGNGICVLSPSVCTVTEEAGGEYELEMEHPFDPWGKYEMLQEDYIIRAPVPPMELPEITLPPAAVWNVKSTVTQTPLYSRLPTYTKSKSAIDTVKDNPSSYQWDASTPYPVGYYVIYGDYIYISNVANQNKQPGTGNEWASTGVKVSGGSGSDSSPSGGTYDPGTVAENLSGGELVTKIADYNSTYMQVRSLRGITGYVRRADCEETSQSAEGTVIPARTIITQLFRIYEVSSDETAHTVTVNARHINYDFQGNKLFACQLTEATPQTAIAIMQGSLMNEDQRLIACDMAGEISGDYSFLSPIQALLDPDDGIVAQLQAKVIRDNKDIFILDNSSPRRGPDLIYGVNLRGVEWSRNMEDVITRIIPRADDGNKGYLFLDELFVDSEYINDFAVINIEVLDSEYSVGQEIEKADGSKQTLTRDDVLQRMREEAEKRFSVDHADAILVSLDVQFLLLGDTEQYKQYRGLQRVNLYDSIIVKTGRMEITAQVTGYEWDCLRKRYNGITVGRIYGQNRHDIHGYRMSKGTITYSKLAPGLINRIKGESA